MATTGIPAETSGQGAKPSRAFLVLAGPLIGLAYIIVLPCIGAGLLLFFAGRRAYRGVSRLWAYVAPARS
jgi:hypothetical protein